MRARLGARVIMSAMETAIQSIFSGSPTAAESNEFLLAFVETEAAWGEALALFNSESLSVRYFAANIIYNKVKRHWPQLNGQQRDSLLQVLLGSLTSSSGKNDLSSQKPFVNRVMMAFACVCSRIPVSGIPRYIHTALLKISPGSLTTEIVLGLEMLSVFPEEVESLDVEHSLREELQGHLLEASGAVLETIDSIAVASASNNVDHAIKLGALKVLRSWLLVAIVSPSKMQESHEPSWRLVYESLQSGNAESVTEACSFLRAIVQIEDYPRATSRDGAILNMVSMIISSMPSIIPLFHGGDVACDVCDCLVSLASHEIRLLSHPRTCNVELFQLILMFSATKPRKIASLTFEVWLTLQEVPVSDRHTFVTQEVFYKLLGILLDQISLPVASTTLDDNDEEGEDMTNFRDSKNSSLQEVVLVCYYSLQALFFTQIGERLTQFSTSPAENWPMLETSLFVLYLSMDAIKSAMHSQEGGATSAQFLLNTLQLILQIPQHLVVSHGELHCTICRFIGSATFLLASDSTKPDFVPFQTFYVPALEYVFQALGSQNSQVVKFAAKATYQLCIHGQRVGVLITTPVIVPPGQHDSLSAACSSLLIHKLVIAMVQLLSIPTLTIANDDESMNSVIECVVRAIATLPHAFARTLIEMVGTPIIDGIKHELQLTSTGHPINVERLSNLFKFSGQIIRFCADMEPEEGQAAVDPSKHVLYNFLSNLWPPLQALESIPHFNQLGTLCSRVFDLYGRSFMSASVVVMSEAPRILRAVVSVVQNRGEGSVAALQCCRNIVEVASSQGNAGSQDMILVQLLQYLSQIMLDQIQQQAFPPDPEVLETLFNLVFTVVTTCPQVLVSSTAPISQMLRLSLAALSSSRERGTIKAVLQVVKPFYFPPPALAQKLQPFQQQLFAEARSVGPVISKILVDFIGGSGPNGCNSIDSTLRHCIVDTFYHLIIGCEGAHGGESRMWVNAAIFSSDVLPMLSPELKEFVAKAMFTLANTNHRRFKALVMDVCKIGCSELPVDCLGGFSDVA